ncbi:MAG TPA: protein-disulfide reductase DsbD N-terminal domain-containing protein, partial [Thermoanaerobaculia bacterium]|nr:protein-disulfide reductase DsbD N-terminal domain-containing protein [Thermoanaerobaculia bacterium]
QPRTGGPPWPPSGGTLGELEREALEVVRPHLEPFAGAPTRLRLRLVIAPGWHLQAQPASEPFLVPTTLEAEHGLELTSVSYPEGKLWNLGGSEIRVYQGEVVLEAELAASPQPGAALRLSYQACNEQRCLPPLARLLAIES